MSPYLQLSSIELENPGKRPAGNDIPSEAELPTTAEATLPAGTTAGTTLPIAAGTMLELETGVRV